MLDHIKKWILKGLRIVPDNFRFRFAPFKLSRPCGSNHSFRLVKSLTQVRLFFLWYHHFSLPLLFRKILIVWVLYLCFWRTCTNCKSRKYGVIPGPSFCHKEPSYALPFISSSLEGFWVSALLSLLFLLE